MKTARLTRTGLLFTLTTQAQMSFNTPPGVKLSEDFMPWSVPAPAITHSGCSGSYAWSPGNQT
ncbi:MAG: hypothetical protein LH606_11960, partial [Cytophagaceae bacterium]|nr:hypothetical protein [Cytophagaceae bacterium]